MFKKNSLLITLTALFFLSGCQKDDHSTPAQAGAAPNTMQGPSDGGGGDTCNGKMIESFRVDISTLDEYKEFILPIINKVSTPATDKTKQTPFTFTPSFKNWYIIDCKLQDIPKERKGLYLETYQTAIHTSREIFIDSSSYEKMAREEKAKLILHEMLMSYYLLKYLSIEEMCKISSAECNGDIEKISKWKMFKPEPYHPLNEEDHQKIRNVTAWLWQQKNSVDPISFTTLLKRNDFDKRFDYGLTSTSKDVEVDTQTILRMFKKYQWTNSFPQYCQFDPNSFVSLSSCQIELISDLRDFSDPTGSVNKILYLKVKITRSSDHKVFEQEFSFFIDAKSEKIKLSVSKVGSIINSSTLGYVANWPNYQGVVPQEGLKSQFLIVMLNLNDIENPEIYQFVFQSYIWYSFEDVIVKRDGFTYKDTYGYANLLPNESENIFVENELLFSIGSMLTQKVFIKSVLVTN